LLFVYHVLISTTNGSKLKLTAGSCILEFYGTGIRLC